MPTNRRRRSRGRTPTVSSGTWAFLNDEPIPDDANPFEILRLKHPGQRNTELAEAWAACRDSILKRWTRARPGTRPRTWWRLEAPGPRQRLGGVGTPSHEALAYAPAYNRGIPLSWIRPWEVEHYQNIDMEAIDPADPPIFESEAAYLARHGLMDAAELEAAERRGLLSETESVMPGASER